MIKVYSDTEIERLRQRLRASGLRVSMVARLTGMTWGAVKAFYDGNTTRMHLNNLARLEDVLCEHERQERQERKGA